MLSRNSCLLVLLLIPLGGCSDPSNTIPPGNPQPASSSTVGTDPNNNPPHSPEPSVPAARDPAYRTAQTAVTSTSSGALANQENGAANEQQDPAPSDELRTRRPDTRRRLADAQLQGSGIHVWESRTLKLCSDASDLPGDELCRLADQLFETLQVYFGPLPDARDGTSFQVTGYIMEEEARFAAVGLLPPESFIIRHGRHRDYEFWMRVPDTDYYLRHLMLHEFVHCYMTCESGMTDIPPLWYIEGMAEYFATHRTAEEEARFSLLPDSYLPFSGWGRISELRRHNPTDVTAADSSPVSLADAKPLVQITDADRTRFDDDRDYAYAWALCWWMHHHPQTKQLMQELSLTKTRSEFTRQLDSRMAAIVTDAGLPLRRKLATDWLLFLDELIEGFDPLRGMPVHRIDSTDTETAISVVADRGWQDSGRTVVANQPVRFTAKGLFQIANVDEKPWMSGPEGVTIRWWKGAPLGCLVGIIIAEDGSQMTNRFRIGPMTQVSFPVSGRLWLQLNDVASERADNSGSVRVTVRNAD